MPANSAIRMPRSVLTDRLSRVSLRSAQVLVLLILGSVLVWSLVQVKLIVIPLLIAIILAAGIGPVVNWLVDRRVPSALATWVTFLAGLILLGGTAVMVTFAVRSQWDMLTGALDAGLKELQALLKDSPIPIDADQIAAARDSIADFLSESLFGNGALAGVSVAVQALTGVLLVVVLLFFLLKDGGRIWEFLLRPFEGEQLERGRRVGRRALAVLGGYLRGTALVALIDAVAIGVALAILQVPLALPLAVIVFLTAFIPVIGATLGGAAAALVALVGNGPTVALIVVAVVFVVNQLEGNLLQPIVVGQSVRLHPIVIVFALTAGTALAGIVGAVLAVPITATAWAVLKAWNQPADRVIAHPEGDRAG